MKQLIKNFGEFNKWKGCMALYFTQREIRQMKKYGITGEMSILEAYNLL